MSVLIGTAVGIQAQESILQQGSSPQGSLLGPRLDLNAATPHPFLPPPPFEGLRILAHGGVQEIANNVGAYQFDLVNRLDTPSIAQTFTLRNANEEPFTNLQVRFSTPNAIHVLVALKSLAGFSPQPILPGMAFPTLKPGEEMTLSVTLDLAAIPPGAVQQWIEVIEPNRGQAIARLEMSGSVLPVVSFTPEFVDFGHVPAGQTKTVNLTVRIDPRLAPSGSVPQLFCSNPYVRIQPVPLDLKMLRTSPLLTLKQKAEGLYSYQLTLWEDASLGNITGSIIVASITPPAEGRPKNLPAIDPSIATAALHSATAFLTGHVEGDITAAPTSVVFGTVPQGQQAIQSVLISPKTVISLQGAQLSSPTPWLSARWVAETDVVPINPHPERPLPQRLEVILSPNTPAGRLQTELVLTLANGQRLALPVSATVLPNTAGK